MGRLADLARHPWQWTHLALGALGLAAFLFTGLYMDRRLDHLVGMPDGPRALYRSGHIYILFSALLHLALGAHFALAGTRLLRLMQYLGSTLLFVSLGLFVISFFVETPLAMVERPLVRLAIEASFGGILLHAAGGVAHVAGTRPV